MKKPHRIVFLLAAAALACSDTPDTSADSQRAARDAAPTVATQPPSLSCGVDSSTALTGDGLGNLRIGASVTDVRRACRVLRDSVIPFREGMPERVLVAQLASDTVQALVEDERVTLLFIHSPAFRTEGGLGVGSTIGELRETGPGTVSHEEGTHIKLRGTCGLVFYPGRVNAPLRAALAEIPADPKVERVVVAGCGPGARYYSP